MSRANETWEENPLNKLAEAEPFRTPGMYLIALREHLNRGKNALEDIVESVAEALPKAPRFLQRQEAEEPESLAGNAGEAK